MYMPDDFDIPQDNLDDLLELEYEAEMEVMRAMEEAAMEAAIKDNQDGQKEDRPPKTNPPSQRMSQDVNSKTSWDKKESHVPEDILRSPCAKRARVSTEISPCGDTANPVLKDISNFRSRVAEIDPVHAPTQIRIPLMGERKFYRRIPEGSDYRSITTTEGNRFYIRLKGDDDSGELDFRDSIRFSRPTGLCGIPYEDLLEQATLENAKNLQSSIDLETESGYESAQDGDSEDIASLWVEKFRPKSYLQLLSDDGTNRTLLRWLKLWDKLVFGTEKKPSTRHHQQPNPNEANDGKKFQGQPSSEVIEEVDEMGRPKQKVALLHGPPGLGKTTLAHVVAKHAGYNVVEMNASDDRSVESFKIKLEAATQMRSVTGQDPRPNCLIIDEIDGAPSPTIQFLVGLITGAGSGSKKKKNANRGHIQRPIICICNDLYTPSLRTLRQQALIIQFPPTLSNRLAQRLLDIAGRERLHTDLTALLALCEKTGDDIRACLSTLQFFKSRGQRLRLADVHRSHVGQKDVHKSHFTVWEEIFRIPRTSKRKVDDREENVASPAARFRNVLHTVQACGDYDRLQQGVFENYLNLKFKDSRMENVGLGQDWFCFFDMANQQIMHTQNYSMMAYLSYSFVMSHFMFSTMQKSKLAYPATMNEKRNAQQKCEHSIQTLLSDMTPVARAFNPVQMLIRDTLPYLLTIIQPNLRPVNTHLYSAREKTELHNLVNLMISYNLNYVQEKTLEGAYIYRLEPCVEEVVFFPEQNHPTVAYAIKQMISHEVEMEAMRRKEPTADYVKPVETKNQPVDPNNQTVEPEKSKSKDGNMRKKEDLVKKLIAKDIQVHDRVPVDFFGRPISNPKGDLPPNIHTETDGILSSDVWFKFKEGYNNAVRRNIRVLDLM